MSGVVKILAKEIVELAHRPFLLFWLATLPTLLTLVAGSISKGEPHETLVLAGRTQNETETGRARQLLAEIAGLIVVEIKGPVPDIVAVMERESRTCSCRRRPQLAGDRTIIFSRGASAVNVARLPDCHIAKSESTLAVGSCRKYYRASCSATTATGRGYYR